MERRDPYRILQVQPDADPDVVKAAYRVLARKLHPDAGTPLDVSGEQRMADLNWAYSVVRDPVKRSLWESDRRRAPPPTPAERATHGAPRGPLSADGGDQRLDFFDAVPEPKREAIDDLFYQQEHVWELLAHYIRTRAAFLLSDNEPPHAK